MNKALKIICSAILLTIFFIGIASANPDKCVVAQKFSGVGKQLYLTTLRCNGGYVQYNRFVRRNRRRGMATMWVRCARDNCTIARSMIGKYVRKHGRLPLQWHKTTLPGKAIVNKKYTCVIARRWKASWHMLSRLQLFTVACGVNGPNLKPYRRRRAEIMWVRCAFNRCKRAKRLIVKYVRHYGRLPLQWNGKTL